WGSAEQLRVDRAAVYRFHATVAERFRAGPVFLVGDAAHTMPPFNGQGMCTGMRDAENLSWKLALVADGRADDSLLDTYDAERRPHATGQVAHSVDAGLLIDAIAHDGDAALEKGYGQQPFPGLAHGLIHGDHPAIGHPLPRPHGDGIPIDAIEQGWTLITADDPAEMASLWNDLAATNLQAPADAWPGIVSPGVTVVVRPDRYVAAVTADIDNTTGALADLLRRAPASGPDHD
ncbi:MAG: FAD-dependent monooxygenase, partial [Acidimicrobiales bacterium]